LKADRVIRRVMLHKTACLCCCRLLKNGGRKEVSVFLRTEFWYRYIYFSSMIVCGFKWSDGWECVVGVTVIQGFSK